ncbi:HEAT repeat domain-containing protein [Streptomyces camelliae]|uniref:HEAT repeat domain-containing protein n=1 Tax=Streptomyces camelliae TaxID=3004093 RepID=A0ABY7PDD7_9ACTN|nr:HEAT repeat domain-containing protein [Streptomyces sp. HUAS 2-6]WBO67904.1 HEAT repeat domain-containing protein [Streptomyces sp. HUAS 2-6]
MDGAVFHRSRRLVFRHPDPSQAERVATQHGWASLGSRGGHRKAVELVWAVDDETTFHCVEDVASGEFCCFFRGSRIDGVTDAFRRIDAEVDAWSSAELIDQVYAEAPPMERVGALFRLGLGAPAAFDDEFFDAFMVALRDEHPMIRAAAARTAAYMEWPQLLPELRIIASGDTDARVRGEAEQVVSVFESAENGAQ